MLSLNSYQKSKNGRIGNFQETFADIPASQENHIEGADDCAEHPRRAGHCGVCPRERHVGRHVWQINIIRTKRKDISPCLLVCFL